MIEKVKLGEKVEFQRGYDLTHDNMNGGPYPVVGSTSIIGYHDAFKAENGITLGRSGTVGIPQLINGKYWPHNTSLFTTDLKGNNREYLFYLLVNLHIDKLKTGSNIPTLNRNDIYPLEVPFETDVLEQKKIAGVLSTIDSKIANNTAICSELEAMAKLLYDYWFVQFDFPDENGKPYKSSGGKMVWNEELKREIPTGWEAVPFEKCITSINTGLNPRDNFKLNIGGNIKYLTVKNLTTDGSIDFSACDMIDEEARSIVHRRSDIAVGDILFASISPLGRCHVITDEPTDWDINESVFSIRPNYQNMTSNFLYMTFMSDAFVKKAEGSSTGSVFKGIRIAELQALKTILPPKDTLDKFEEEIQSVFTMKSSLFDENQQLKSLRDFLLPMLMNGQVKVKETV